MEENERKFNENFRKEIEENEKRLKETNDNLNRGFQENLRNLEEINRRTEENNRRIIAYFTESNRRISELLNQMNSSRNNKNNSNYKNLIETRINVDKLTEDNKRCVICYEDFKDNDESIFLPCFHVFHKKCIKKWLKYKDFCPLCKISVNNNLNNN